MLSRKNSLTPLCLLFISISFLVTPYSASAAYITSTLSVGSSGTQVLTLQQELQTLGYLQATPTGYFGLLTEAAVAAFQAEEGLDAVGYTGPKTRLLLSEVGSTDTLDQASSIPATSMASSTSPTYLATTTIISETLSLGSQGLQVTALQDALFDLGLLLVEPTGYFGSLTQKALLAFQNQNNIVTSPGSTGVETRGLINFILAKEISIAAQSSPSSIPTSATAATTNTSSVSTPATSPITTTTSPTTASGGGGGGGSISTTVIPAATCTLAATPTSIAQGGSTTLSWTGTNTSAITLDQGYGSLTSDSSGSLIVSPSTTTTYTATATGTGGSNTCAVTVTVTTLVPTISSIVATPSTNSATITWTTNENASSTISYGFTSIYGFASSSPSSNTSHSITLTGLSPSTLYHYRILSSDSFGNSAASTDATFTTSATVDTAPPTVSMTLPTPGATVSGTAIALTATASDNVAVAGVTFYVDGTKQGSEVTSFPYTYSWNSTATSSGSHMVFAVARDTSNNYATSTSVSFTVGSVGTVISSLTSGALSSSSATISWTTSTPASSVVNYGTTSGYGTASSTAALVTNHSITLSGLSAGTTYHFQVSSTDSSNNDVSSTDQTFITTANSAPTVSLTSNSYSITSGNSATLSWSSTNATSCTTTGFSGGTSTFGAVSVSPTATTTYSVGCTGAGGTTTQSVTIAVAPAGPTLPTLYTASVSSQTVVPGESFTITYKWNGVPMSTSYLPFGHFLDSGYNVAFQDGESALPYGLTTQTWSGPLTYTDTITVPSSQAPGTYTITAGLFQNTTGFPKTALTAGPGVAPITSPYSDPYEYTIGTITVASTTTTGSGTGTGLPFSISSLTPTFDDEFNSLSLYNLSTGQGTWFPEYPYGGTAEHFLTNEAEYYTFPGDEGTGSTPIAVNPFSILNGGGLQIQAATSSSSIESSIYNQPYTSGMLSTYYTFSQEYGYYEMRAKLPAGQGLWPAFWMLAQNRSYPPELDIFEMLGDSPTTLHFTTHYGTGSQTGDALTVSDMSTDYHTYGLLWTPATVTLYFDGTQIDQLPTPADMNQPMYILADLAVGGAGSWPGAPTASTTFPANMDISYIRAYQLPGYPAPLKPTITLSSANANVNNPSAPLEAFTASSSTIPYGGSVTLTWNSTAGLCTASGGTFTGYEGPYGTLTVTDITQSTTYTLVCTDQSGSNPNTQSVTVTVNTSLTSSVIEAFSLYGSWLAAFIHAILSAIGNFCMLVFKV